ncbi:alpha/beta hydrolase [Gordonia sp. CPCC 205515]|uniref:lipase family alpha/beta hydrolase n=1 Tax=Gordonia sp. CPCC 205515 TaxID=3140791 RepID=UPI003AF369EE
MCSETADRRTEVVAMTRLGSRELGRALVGISKMHATVADSVFSGLRCVLGDSVESARAIHDTVSTGTYGAVAATVATAGRLAEIAAETTGGVPSHSSRGATGLAILNGLIGDELAGSGSPLAPEMSIRVRGVSIEIEPAELTDAYPHASSHLVVFLHGLMEAEYAWSGGGKPTYGARFADDFGATEIQIRYNTGRHISDNGRELSALLTKLVLLWPVPVTEVTLVGHSMGGLIIRSACHAAADDPYWLSLVRHTVSLGTPHLGAPLAKGVHAATTVLRTTPATRPLGNLLGRRSAGVRDLFHGTLTDDGWLANEPDALRQKRAADLELIPGARHLFVTASLTRDPRHPLGRIIGDGMVLDGSGRGQSRSVRIGFRTEDGFHIGGANHFTLLNSDAIYAWLVEQLRPRKMLPAA